MEQFLKLGIYRNKKRLVKCNIFIPSTITLLLFCTTILTIQQSKKWLFLLLPICCLLVISFNLKNFSIKVIFNYILIPFVLVILFYGHLKLLNGNVITNTATKAVITSSVNKGYYQQLKILCFQKEQKIPIKIIAFSQPPCKIKTGDIVFLHENLSPLKTKNAYLKKKGISGTYNFKTNNYSIVGQNTFLSKVAQLKDKISYYIKIIFDQHSAPIVEALILADKSNIDNQSFKLFKTNGALHLLAASGMHVGILTFFGLFSGKLLRQNRKYILFRTNIIILSYLILTGLPVSLLRAWLMYFFYSIQELFGATKNPLNVIFRAATLILFISPFQLYNLGFQLSFAATFSIIIFYNKYEKILKNIPGTYLKSLCILGITAQIATLPILYFQLEEINISGLFTGILEVPLITCIFPIAIISLFIFIFSHQIINIGFIVNFLVKILLQIQMFFTKFTDFTIITAPSFSDIILITLIMILPLILFKVTKSNKTAIIGFNILLICFSVFNIKANQPAKNELKISTQSKIEILSQQDKIFLKIKKITKEDAKQLERFLLQKDIKEIDLYLESLDYQTLNTVMPLVKKTVIKKCYFSPETDYYFSNKFNSFIKLCAQKQVKIIFIKPQNEKELKKYYLHYKPMTIY